MNANAAAVQHTLALLRADATLDGLVTAVYEATAPEGAATPYLLVQLSPEAPADRRNGPYIASKAATVSVRGVSTADTLAELVPIAVRVEEVLHGSYGTYPVGRVSSCTVGREQYTTEMEQGTPVRYLGHLFTLTVS